MTEARSELVLQLGRDHGKYGELATGSAGPLAWAISVGADKDSPSRQFKGDLSVPNEDGLLGIARGGRVLVAVADAHFGAESSADLLAALAAELGAASRPLPASSAELGAALQAAAARVGPVAYASETTCLLVSHDADSCQGWGLCLGDSSFMLLGPEGPRLLTDRGDMRFVSPARPEDFAGIAEAGHPGMFSFYTRPDELLLAFTDGIDGCHYTHPETSIQDRHLAALYEAEGSDPARFVRALAELALSGVDGNPGGQDNIAILAAPA